MNMQILYKNIFYVIKFFGWKSSRENDEYMTRIIFLDGNPNRRPDFSNYLRETPAQANTKMTRKAYLLYSLKLIRMQYTANWRSKKFGPRRSFSKVFGHGQKTE